MFIFTSAAGSLLSGVGEVEEAGEGEKHHELKQLGS